MINLCVSRLEYESGLIVSKLYLNCDIGIYKLYLSEGRMNNELPEINIKEELKKIKRKGFIKSLRKDNTGIGYTLEETLGIKENNNGEPDFTYNGLKVELKAQRKKAGSRVTLSTKSPIWDTH